MDFDYSIMVPPTLHDEPCRIPLSELQMNRRFSGTYVLWVGGWTAGGSVSGQKAIQDGGEMICLCDNWKPRFIMTPMMDSTVRCP